MKPKVEAQTFIHDCPSRRIFDTIADKWSMMVLAVLFRGPARFNSLRRHLDGVTQKALTQSLRRLERNGMISRHVIPVSPVAVEYKITNLGQSLHKPLLGLHAWIMEHLKEIEKSQAKYDRLNEVIDSEQK